LEEVRCFFSASFIKKLNGKVSGCQVFVAPAVFAQWWVKTGSLRDFWIEKSLEILIKERKYLFIFLVLLLLCLR